MPYVNIKITREDKEVTREQKRRLIAEITRVMGDVLERDVRTLEVIIDEIPTDNWGFGGKTVTEIREIQKAKAAAKAAESAKTK